MQLRWQPLLEHLEAALEERVLGLGGADTLDGGPDVDVVIQ